MTASVVEKNRTKDDWQTLVFRQARGSGNPLTSTYRLVELEGLVHLTRESVD